MALIIMYYEKFIMYKRAIKINNVSIFDLTKGSILCIQYTFLNPLFSISDLKVIF